MHLSGAMPTNKDQLFQPNDVFIKLSLIWQIMVTLITFICQCIAHKNRLITYGERTQIFTVPLKILKQVLQTIPFHVMYNPKYAEYWPLDAQLRVIYINILKTC